MVTLLLALAGCAPDTASKPDIGTMDTVRALTRTSLDLRGVRPTPEEIAQVEADPAALDTLTDTFLADPRFGDRVRDMWAEIYLTRSESYLIGANQYGLDDQAVFQQSIGEEDLQILAYVANNDLPYTELVTGDWTMANETLASIWPLDYPAGSEGWVKTRYTDGRPAAGILATNSIWWRYTSTESNANRKRANTISRIFLCNDYLTRPVEFDRNVNLLDQGAVDDALNNNPACMSCHTTLDPFASYLFGFWWYDYTNPGEASFYFPERENRWRDYTAKEPGYYGQPGYSLSDLGHQIAEDRRFPECATQQALSLLLRRDLTTADTDALNHHRDDFINGGLTIRALVKSIVQDDRYRSPSTDEAGYVPLKMVTPDLLATQMQDLTGFTWTYSNYDMLRNDGVGFRTLSGGADGYNVTATSKTSNATLILVQERLAEASAWYTVYSEPTRLFPTLDFTETPDTNRDAMVTAIQGLFLRIYGQHVAADGEEVGAGLELWASLYAVQHDPREAWAGYLTALLRDPDLLFY